MLLLFVFLVITFCCNAFFLQARRKLSSAKTKAFNSSITVDWADPIDEPSEEIMAKVRFCL